MVASKQVANTASTLLETGKYSDFRIKTDSEVFKVHKSVLCLQYDYFENQLQVAAEQGGERDVVDWTHYCPLSVKALLQCLYTGDYEVPEVPKEATRHSHARFHLSIALIADDIQAQDAELLALQKLEGTMFAIPIPELADVLSDAYTYKPDLSAKLKTILLKHSVANNQALPSEGAFFSLVADDPSFAVDFTMAMTGRYLSVNIEKLLPGVWCLCYCLTCRMNWAIPLRDLDKKQRTICPDCGEGDWNNVQCSTPIRAWACPSRGCEYTFHAARFEASKSKFRCPSCKKTTDISKWDAAAVSYCCSWAQVYKTDLTRSRAATARHSYWISRIKR